MARRGNGDRSITVRLRPDDLGAVEISVRISGDTIAVRLSGAMDATRDLLKSSLPELRHHLSEAGLTADSVDVALGWTSAQADHQQSGRPAAPVPFPDRSRTPAVLTTTAARAASDTPLTPDRRVDGRVDVRA